MTNSANRLTNFLTVVGIVLPVVVTVISAAVILNGSIGALRGVDVYGRDMRGVIQKLHDAELLVGAQFSLAQGFVKFRDHAFHGQFDEISRVTSESALTFVDGLLITAFR